MADERKVVPFTTEARGLTPSFIVGCLNEKLPEIQAVLVITLYEDGTVVPGWSHMDKGDLAFAAKVLDHAVTKAIVDE